MSELRNATQFHFRIKVAGDPLLCRRGKGENEILLLFNVAALTAVLSRGSLDSLQCDSDGKGAEGKIIILAKPI